MLLADAIEVVCKKRDVNKDFGLCKITAAPSWQSP